MAVDGGFRAYGVKRDEEPSTHSVDFVNYTKESVGRLLGGGLG